MQTKRKEEKGCREKILELERREFEVTRGFIPQRARNSY